MFFRIPAEINDLVVDGSYEGFDFLITDTNDTFGIKIVNQSPKESTCAIRAETHDGKKVYYPQDSKFYNDNAAARCFDTETEAKTAGYKKSAT